MYNGVIWRERERNDPNFWKINLWNSYWKIWTFFL